MFALEQFLLLLAIACGIVFVCFYLRLSPILGYMIAGATIGPLGIGLIDETATAEALGYYGVVFLLFVIALDISFKQLKIMRRMVFGLGLAQVVITYGILAVGVSVFSLSLTTAAIVAASLSLSSTAIVLATLLRSNDMDTPLWNICLSILLFQDLAAIPLIAMISLFEPVQFAFEGLIIDIIWIAISLGGIIVLGMLIIRPMLYAVKAINQPELLTAVALLIVLGTGWITESLGLSTVLGAFLAGVLIAETEFRHQVRSDIEPFQLILLSFFFITIGMRLDIGFIFDQIMVILGLVTALLGVKTLIIVVLCRLWGVSWSLALRIGLALSQGGEFGLVLITLAAERSLIEPQVTQLTFAIIGISIAVTPLLLFLGRWIHAYANEMEKQETLALHHDPSPEVLLIGYGSSGQTIGDLLEMFKVPYIVLDRDLSVKGRKNGFVGDASRVDVLKSIGIRSMRQAVVTIADPQAAQKVVTALKQSGVDLEIFVRIPNMTATERFRELGADTIIPESIECTLHIGEILLSRLDVNPEQIAQALQEFRNTSYARVSDILKQ